MPLWDRYPHRNLAAPKPDRPARPESVPAPTALGRPLSIAEAARLIGCSAWTVRQSLIPNGLPVFRSGPNGKLIFYEAQLVRWIESRQQQHTHAQGGPMPYARLQGKGGHRR